MLNSAFVFIRAVAQQKYLMLITLTEIQIWAGGEKNVGTLQENVEIYFENVLLSQYIDFNSCVIRLN